MIDFLCIAAPKARTTWLMANLARHSELDPSFSKVVGPDFAFNGDWFAQIFSLPRKKAKKEGGRVHTALLRASGGGRRPRETRRAQGAAHLHGPQSVLPHDVFVPDGDVKQGGKGHRRQSRRAHPGNSRSSACVSRRTLWHRVRGGNEATLRPPRRCGAMRGPRDSALRGWRPGRQAADRKSCRRSVSRGDPAC